MTKYAHLVPTQDTLTAKGFAPLFVQHVFANHGMPKSIVSDRGTQWNNKFWHIVCRLLGIDQLMSCAYHPEMDGQTVTEVHTEVHCSFIALLWYGCFRSSSKVLAPMRVKEIPQGQQLRRPQHLRHIPITVHMRVRVKGATTRRGARNTN
jgi:hypothetical protein